MVSFAVLVTSFSVRGKEGEMPCRVTAGVVDVLVHLTFPHYDSLARDVAKKMDSSIRFIFFLELIAGVH